MRSLLVATALAVFFASSLIATATEITPLTELLGGAALDPSIDVTALDELLRGKDRRMLRWAEPPRLVVLIPVMKYAEDGIRHVATGERLTERETEDLVADLTDALAVLSGGTHEGFLSVRHEIVPAGAPVRVSNRGEILVGRYRGVRERLNTLGLGGRRWTGDGRITSGSIVLDEEFDRTSDVRHLLRAHELGHVLGYNHVTSRTSIMNPRIGSAPTDFDRQAARIAFGLLAAR